MEFTARNSKTKMPTPSVPTTSMFVMIMIIFFLISNQRFYQFTHQYFITKSVSQNSTEKDYKELNNSRADFERESQKVASQAQDLINFNSRLRSMGKFNEIAMKATRSRPILKFNRTYESLLRLLETGNYVYCADIFGRKLEIPWTEQQRVRKEQFDHKFQETLQNIVLEIHKRNAPWTDLNVEGNSGGFKDQWKLYYELIQFNFVHTVCETGFNAGHSTFMWLNANPDVHVYSFDIGNHMYVRPMADVLSEMFPGRLNVTFGDSRKTLPEFRQRNPHITCDLVIIDGGHVGDVPLMDFDNFYQMVKPMSKHLVVLDDWPSTWYAAKDMAAMWIGQIQKGRVKTIRQCMNIGVPGGKGMTFGLFTRS